jgi:hypothetical protein
MPGFDRWNGFRRYAAVVISWTSCVSWLPSARCIGVGLSLLQRCAMDISVVQLVGFWLVLVRRNGCSRWVPPPPPPSFYQLSTGVLAFELRDLMLYRCGRLQCCAEDGWNVGCTWWVAGGIGRLA